MGPSTSMGRVVPRLLVMLVVAIVLGILGMHAISAHGVTSEASHGAHASLSGDTSEPGGGLVLGPGADPIAAGTGGGSEEGHDMGRGMGGMGGLAMLCVAMLAATASALLLALGARRTPRFWAILSAAATTNTRLRWVTFALGTGPPPVWEFSVIRC